MDDVASSLRAKLRKRKDLLGQRLDHRALRMGRVLLFKRGNPTRDPRIKSLIRLTIAQTLMVKENIFTVMNTGRGIARCILHS